MSEYFQLKVLFFFYFLVISFGPMFPSCIEMFKRLGLNLNYSITTDWDFLWWIGYNLFFIRKFLIGLRLSLQTICNNPPYKWLILLLNPMLLNIQIDGQQLSYKSMNTFIGGFFYFEHMKLFNLGKTCNFFSAFLYKEARYL